MVGRHVSPIAILSANHPKQKFVRSWSCLLGVISSSVLPPSCRVIFDTPFWRRPFGCPSGEVGGTVVSAATFAIREQP